jgi:thymidylate synthase (FAD)
MTEIILRSDIEVQLVQAVGDDSSIVWAARVSTAGERSLEALEADPEDARGLIRYLLKNRHGTPFEHNSLTFYVRAPIFVYREWHRHRVGFSYNEESGRYTQLQPEFYVPSRERNLVQRGKPGHYEFVPGTDEQYEALIERDRALYQKAYDTYEASLADGVAREVARTVLPVAIYSSMYVTLNLRSAFAFLSLRTKSEDSLFPSYPQREIEMAAELVEETIAERFPIAYEAFHEFGRVAP